MPPFPRLLSAQHSNGYYLRNGYSNGLQISPVHSQCTSEQKSIKHFGEKGELTYLGTVQIFWVLSIISGTGKATNFKFCTHIHVVCLSA